MPDLPDASARTRYLNRLHCPAADDRALAARWPLWTELERQVGAPAGRRQVAPPIEGFRRCLVGQPAGSSPR